MPSMTPPATHPLATPDVILPTATIQRSSRAAWGAILAGAAVALALTVALNMLGVAIGASTVDAADRDSPSAAAFGISAGVWMLATHVVALMVGGFVAGRLLRPAESDSAELHGVGVWAVCFLASALLIGSIAMSAVAGAGNMLANALGGVTQGAANAAGAAVSGIDPAAAIERARITLTSPADPAAMTSEQRVADAGAIMARRLADGSFTPEDRDRLAAIIAAEAGIPPEQAAQRIQAYEARLTEAARVAEQRARQAADAAATATAAAAFWAVVAMMLGLIAAAIGARLGNRYTAHA